jgi:hypothetical protein
MVEPTGHVTATYFRTIEETPVLDLLGGDVPGFGAVGEDVPIRSRWLGGSDEAGPWIYWVEHEAGVTVAPHKHLTDRVEVLLEGAIEWFEGPDALQWLRDADHVGHRYSAGTLNFVPARTLYGYRILEPTKLLLWFYGNPGGTEYAAPTPQDASG